MDARSHRGRPADARPATTATANSSLVLLFASVFEIGYAEN
ncbi:hypothetical protein ACFC8N_25850 [Streptomyces sp. NPDC055966]